MTEAIRSVQAVAAPPGDGRFGVGAGAGSVLPVPMETEGADAVEAAPPEALRTRLESTVEELQRRASESGVDLRFSVDDDLGRVVVTVVDPRDGTVLRQIPSEEALRIARLLREHGGNLVDAIV